MTWCWPGQSLQAAQGGLKLPWPQLQMRLHCSGPFWLCCLQQGRQEQPVQAVPVLLCTPRSA